MSVTVSVPDFEVRPSFFSSGMPTAQKLASFLCHNVCVAKYPLGSLGLHCFSFHSVGSLTNPLDHFHVGQALVTSLAGLLMAAYLHVGKLATFCVYTITSGPSLLSTNVTFFVCWPAKPGRGASRD